MSTLFGKLCRTCLDTPAKLYTFQQKCVLPNASSKTSGTLIRNLLLDVLNPKTPMIPDLPEQICMECLNELMRFHSFLDKCAQSESALKNMLDTAQKTKTRKDRNPTYRISNGAKDDIIIVEFEDNTELETELKEESFGVAKEEAHQEITWSEVTILAEAEEKVLEPVAIKKVPRQNKESKAKEALITVTHEHDDEVDMDDHVADNDDKEDEDQMNYLFEPSIPYEVDDEAMDEESQAEEGNKLTPGRGKNCPECGILFLHAKSLASHRDKYHGVVPVEMIKVIKAPVKTESNSPKKTKQPPPPATDSPSIKENFKCETCGIVFLHKKSLASHTRKSLCKSGSKPQCCVCKRDFVRTSDLIKHLHSHDKAGTDQVIVCTVCPEEKRGEPFVDISALITHMAQHKSAGKHECDECGRCFNMYSTLKDHVRTHTGQKPFVCPICDRGFSQATNLKQHVQRHKQIKDYKCTESGCAGAFVSKGELETHMRIHTGEHPYICECGQKFTTSSSLVSW